MKNIHTALTSTIDILKPAIEKANLILIGAGLVSAKMTPFEKRGSVK
jgi:hypothetical protein